MKGINTRGAEVKLPPLLMDEVSLMHRSGVRSLKRDRAFLWMLLPGGILTFLFSYLPMFGIVIAFQKFMPAKGLFGGQKWIGWANFEYILSLPTTMQVLWNTIVIAFFKIVLGLLVPILFALLLNELRGRRFKKCVQTMIYMPHFLSWVILGGILTTILSPSEGIVNLMLSKVGVAPIYFLGDNRVFRATLIFTDIWKEFGFGTIIYLASLTGIDPNLYEAAAIDGAGRIKQTLHVTLPGLRMIMVLMLVLSLGNVLNAGFDQVFNLYSPLVYETGDIIDTLVYRLGMLQSQFGPATAVGLFKSVVSCLFISVSYFAAYKLADYRIF